MVSASGLEVITGSQKFLFIQSKTMVFIAHQFIMKTRTRSRRKDFTSGNINMHFEDTIFKSCRALLS